MKQLLTLILIATAFSAHCQKEISLDELSSHLGDSVRVRGKISGVRYLEQARNTPTFINVGAAYPNQKLTIVIWGEVRKKLSFAPEQEPYASGVATVSGKVELYKGKPQIVVHDPQQLSVLTAEKLPASQGPQPANK